MKDGNTNPEEHKVAASKDFPDSFYRVAVKAFYKKDGKILFIKKPSGAHELPGGGLDFGEDIRAGLIREVWEELGYKVVQVAANPSFAWTHKFENTRGIEWFYALVLVYEVVIDETAPRNEQAKYYSCEEFIPETDVQSFELAQQSKNLVNALK